MIKDTAAVLIAGGRSSRFGEDKSFLSWGGSPLWEHQFQKVSAFSPTIISHNASQEFPEEIPTVIDSESERGPLYALVDALEWAAESGVKWLVVLGVDLPLMTDGFLRSLAQHVSENNRGIVPQITGSEFFEPLAAIYPVASTLAAAKSRLSSGEKASLQGLVRSLIHSGQVERYEVKGATAELFENLNTPEDFVRLRPSSRPSTAVSIRKYRGNKFESKTDHVVSEEPLELRVEGRSVAVVMRTPGHDEELAAGFLLTEGIVHSPDDIFEIAQCKNVEPEGEGNTLDILLSGSAAKNADLESLTRHVFTSSSCGVCGKATIDSVLQMADDSAMNNEFRMSPEILLSLPGKAREAQATFEKTGGLHASALFDSEGGLQLIREDAGRHNALDKVIGRSLLDNKLPLSHSCLLVSGRVSFELMQKARAAGIPLIAGISAPSSLAVDFALRTGQTLVGFLRQESFNVYAGTSV